MAPETLESPPMDRLDLKSRNFLQSELIKQMIGENPSPEEEMAWAETYAKKVSDKIDLRQYDDNDYDCIVLIRTLAMNEEYDEAARLLRDLLEE